MPVYYACRRWQLIYISEKTLDVEKEINPCKSLVHAYCTLLILRTQNKGSKSTWEYTIYRWDGYRIVF